MPEHTHQTCTEVKLPALTLENPQLWSCESPQLYNAEVVVTADGMVVDSLTEQFGIRSLEFSPEFGFKLNGKKIFLQGNANHHDHCARDRHTLFLSTGEFVRGMVSVL
mgnify:CR=1 FL=1